MTDQSELPAWILDVLDCRGLRIVLEEDLWETKICRKHGEMVDNIYAVEQTLTQPDRINRDAGYDTREVYYRSNVLPVPFEDWLCKVVVETEDSPPRRPHRTVISAFAVDYITPGEQRVWPNRSRLRRR